MKKDKLKKFSLRFGVAFLIVIALLTYFSDTIDNMLLPKVKVTDVIYGTLDGMPTGEDKYLVPLSAVADMGEEGWVFTAVTDEKGNTVVSQINVNITDSDDLYYEVTSDILYSTDKVVYSISKDIAHGDRVYIEE